MFRIINKHILSAGMKRLDILAPEVAAKAAAGQFVMVSENEKSERLPFPIIEMDRRKGAVTIVVKEKDTTTKNVGQMQINQSFFSVLGPLGNPIEIDRVGVVVCVGAGVGIAHILPVCKAFKKKDNNVIGVMGAATKKELILQAQMRIACHKLLMSTEDGSYESRGVASGLLKELLDQRKIDLVYASGSIEMMEAISKMTKKKKVKTLVYLNPPMLDGTGICGSCRVHINGETVLACINGPVFDAHLVDYDDLKVRTSSYAEIA